MSNQVVILAAGIGSRLKPYTETVPKPLVKVNHIPILHNTISNLIGRNILDITIVLGYKHEVITNYLDEHFNLIKFKYVYNEKYNLTNNMYSLYLAVKEYKFSSSLLIIEGDVFFEGSILDYLENVNESKSHWFVDTSYRQTDGSYIRSHEDKVKEISIINNVEEIKTLENYSKSIGLVHISESNTKNLELWLEKYIDIGEMNLYYDNVLANYLNELNMSIIDIKNKKWYEIDSPEDLKKAELIFA